MVRLYNFSAPMDGIRRTVNPRCFLVYATSPEGLSASEADRIFNDFVSDKSLPLAVFHDHFIGRAGGVAIFYIETPGQRDTLLDGDHLPGWAMSIHPLIFSDSPAGFDEQIAFTLKAYRQQNWEGLKRMDRPTYGDARREADTAEGDVEKS